MKKGLTGRERDHRLTAAHTCTMHDRPLVFFCSVRAVRRSSCYIHTWGWPGDGIREPEGLVYHNRTCIFTHAAPLEETVISGLWSMCESRKLKYSSYQHHHFPWETRRVKHQMLWLYFASVGRPSHVTLRDLGPALCLHMLNGLSSRREHAPVPLAVKEGCCSTHSLHHSEVSTCLSSRLTNFRWFPAVCVTALRFVNGVLR